MNSISACPTPPPSPVKQPQVKKELTEFSRYRIKRMVGRLNMSTRDMTDQQLIQIAGRLHISCQFVEK